MAVTVTVEPFLRRARTAASARCAGEDQRTTRDGRVLARLRHRRHGRRPGPAHAKRQNSSLDDDLRAARAGMGRRTPAPRVERTTSPLRRGLLTLSIARIVPSGSVTAARSATSASRGCSAPSNPRVGFFDRDPVMSSPRCTWRPPNARVLAPSAPKTSPLIAAMTRCRSRETRATWRRRVSKAFGPARGAGGLEADAGSRRIDVDQLDELRSVVGRPPAR